MLPCCLFPDQTRGQCVPLVTLSPPRRRTGCLMLKGRLSKEPSRGPRLVERPSGGQSRMAPGGPSPPQQGLLLMMSIPPL